MSTTEQVLYGLIQVQNPDLTMPSTHISFAQPAINTQAMMDAKGRNSNVAMSATGYGDAVTIYYDRVLPANNVADPSSLAWLPNISVAPGTYSTTADFVAQLVEDGFPITSADIVPVTLQNYWTQPMSWSYMYLASARIKWAAGSVGYTGPFWVNYGPSTPADFATTFPLSYYNGLFGSAITGDPADALSSYTSSYLSAQQLPFGARVNRMQTTYSDLVVLDEATSGANGDANSSCLVTFGPNPNYPDEPHWPYYTGSQTVYYNRIDPVTEASQVMGYYGNFVTDDGANPVIPLGDLLGTTVVTSGDLHDYLVANFANLVFDKTDIVIENLPTAYGENGTVTYNFTFQNSYVVLDGQMPVTLSHDGPDMSAIVGTTNFGTTNMLANMLRPGFFSPQPYGDISTAVLFAWASTYFQTSTDQYTWLQGLTASVVPGSVQGAPDEQTGTGATTQATINIVTPWGASFQTVVYYAPSSLPSTLGADESGIFQLYTDTVTASVPMRVIDWLLGAVVYSGQPGNTSVYTPVSQLTAYGEFTNLYDLVGTDVNGNLSFTVAAAPNSTVQSGSITFQIGVDNTLPELEDISPAGMMSVFG